MRPPLRLQNTGVTESPRHSPLSDLWWSLPRIGKAGNGRAIGVLSVWIVWDRFLEWRWKPRLIRPDGVLRYRLMRHQGHPVTLRDGTVGAPGDLLAEMHFDNLVLMRDQRVSEWTPWQVLEQVDRDLDALAVMVSRGELGPVRALHAATMYWAPARRFGFERYQVPHTLSWSLRRYFLIGLVPIYHRDGWKEFDRMRRDRWPGELWMSVQRLQARNQGTPA